MESPTIRKAIGALLEASPRGSEVILFGSHARGQARAESDLDFLVIQPQPADRLREAARLDRVLHALHVPADVLVISRDIFEEWQDTPNTVIYEAAREGKRFREVA